MIHHILIHRLFLFHFFYIILKFLKILLYIHQQKKFLNKLEKHGGKVFLAHLYLYSLDNHIEYLEHLVKEKIIDGVEVYYSGFNLEQIEKLKTFCNTHNLLMSGGTDCHGTRKPIKLGIGLGNLNISEDVVKDWIWEMN